MCSLEFIFVRGGECVRYSLYFLVHVIIRTWRRMPVLLLAQFSCIKVVANVFRDSESKVFPSMSYACRLAASLGPATVQNALILLFDMFYCVKVVASLLATAKSGINGIRNVFH